MIPRRSLLGLFMLVVLSLDAREGHSHSIGSKHKDDTLDEPSMYGPRAPPLDDYGNLDDGYSPSGGGGFGGSARSFGGRNGGQGIMDIVNQLISKYGHGGANEEAKIKEVINQIAGPVIQRVVSMVENLFNKGGSGSGLPIDIGSMIRKPGNGGGGGLDNSGKPAVPPDYSDPFGDEPMKPKGNSKPPRVPPSFGSRPNPMPPQEDSMLPPAQVDSGMDYPSPESGSTGLKDPKDTMGNTVDKGDMGDYDGPMGVSKPDNKNRGPMDEDVKDTEVDIEKPSNSNRKLNKKSLPPLGEAKPFPFKSKKTANPGRSIPNPKVGNKSKMTRKTSSKPNRALVTRKVMMAKKKLTTKPVSSKSELPNMASNGTRST